MAKVSLLDRNGCLIRDLPGEANPANRFFKRALEIGAIAAAAAGIGLGVIASLSPAPAPKPVFTDAAPPAPEVGPRQWGNAVTAPLVPPAPAPVRKQRLPRPH